MNDRIANLVLPALTMRQILIIVSLEFLTLLHQSGYCQTGVKDDLASQAQATQLIGKCDLEVLLSVSRKMGRLAEPDIKSFLLTFGKECGSNIEYSEWSNELLFKVLHAQTKLVLKTMEGAESIIDIEAILSDLSSPINDGIDVKGLLTKVDAVRMNIRLKRQIVGSLNEAIKKM